MKINIRIIIYTVFCFSLLFQIGCKSKEGKTSDKEAVYKQKGESFDSFYQRFFSDKKFQISRVTFPLKCQIAESDRTLTVMYEKDWELMVVPIDKVDRNTYKVKKTQNMHEVTHRIYIENSDVDILVRYKLIKGKWYLVFYKSIML